MGSALKMETQLEVKGKNDKELYPLSSPSPFKKEKKRAGGRERDGMGEIRRGEKGAERHTRHSLT